MATPRFPTAWSGLADALPDARRLRRELRGLAEVSGREHHTAARLRTVLEDAGVEVTTIPRMPSLIAHVGSGDSPAVVLRAELDGLPSEDGARHVCGHDVHAAALTAVLVSSAQRPGRRLVGVFQSSEETYPSGAQALVTAGAFDGMNVRAAIGMHVHPDVEWGAVAVAGGAVNAGADEIRIEVEGRSGHGGYPHDAADSISALAHAIVTAQHALARRSDPMVPAVLSFGSITGGDSANVLPARAEARGTLRAMGGVQRARVLAVVEDAVKHAAASFGCSATVVVTPGEPPLENDAELAAAIRRQLDSFALRSGAAMRSCGADDFAYFAAIAPVVMGFVGLRGHPEFDQHPLHHPLFAPPDTAVDAVAAALAASVEAVAAPPSGTRSAR